jgi:SAM-dependent methyltransferase
VPPLTRQTGRLASLLRLEIAHAQVRYVEVLREQLRAGVRWLDLGCGHQIVPTWAVGDEEQAAMVAACARAVGIDVDAAIVRHRVLRQRVAASGYALPFVDASFDLVTANMVLEHLEAPVVALREVARVLAPGGRMLIHTPNRFHPAVRMASVLHGALKRRLVWWLEQRVEEDVFPTFYRMNDELEIRACAAEAGLRVARLRTWNSVGILSAVPVLRSLELPVLWLLERPRFESLRSNYLAVLERQAAAAPSPRPWGARDVR